MDLLVLFNKKKSENAAKPIPATTWYAVVADDAAVTRHDVATLDDVAWHAAARDDAVTNDAARHATADDVARHAAAADDAAWNAATYDAITNDVVDADDGSAPANDATAHDAARHAVAHDATRYAIAYDDVAGHARTRAANDGANWSHDGSHASENCRCDNSYDRPRTPRPLRSPRQAQEAQEIQEVQAQEIQDEEVLLRDEDRDTSRKLCKKLLINQVYHNKHLYNSKKHILFSN